MDDVQAWAMAQATDDVTDTVRWLEDNGFRPRSAIGGPTAGFGDVALEHVRGRVVVRIVRDRGQWSIAMAAPGVPQQDLHVLLTAMTGVMDEPDPPRRPGAPLPVQLPEGVVWRVAVPRVVAWLLAARRGRAVRGAAARWEDTMRRRLGPPGA